jgi:hypothetical protein
VKAKLTIETEDGDIIAIELDRFHIREDCDVHTAYDGYTGPPIDTVKVGPTRVTITGELVEEAPIDVSFPVDLKV